MPVSPYPVDGVVYGTDSKPRSGATVFLWNVNTQEKISFTTNGAGQFILDAANLPSGYSNGHKLQITAMYSTGGVMASLSKRHTIDTTTGSYSIGNMYLHTGDEPFAQYHTYIIFAAHTNSSSGGLYVDFYDRKNDAFLFRIETGAGDTETLPVGYQGVDCLGGFIRVFESETAGESSVLTVMR